MVDNEKQRREFMRWVLLISFYNSIPLGAWEEVLISIVQGIYADVTRIEMRRQLDYLDERGLVKLRKTPDGRWFGELTRGGVDIVEYTVDIEPGIARPAKLG
jgi:hypothetical protein